MKLPEKHSHQMPVAKMLRLWCQELQDNALLVFEEGWVHQGEEIQEHGWKLS